MKRRPQLALAGDGTVFAVWEEEAEGSIAQNGLELYYAWRDPASGAWSVAARIPATDRARWPLPQKVSEWYPRVQLDGAGNLHLVYNARMQPTSGGVQSSAYYLVGRGLTGGAPSWTAPLRVDPAGRSLYAGDDLRLLVRADPAGAHDAVGYVLWTGHAGNTANLSRVGYVAGSGTLSLVDEAPIVNPQGISAAPVAVLERDASTLQLVYAARNGTSGNLYYGASLALGGDGGVAWQDPADGLAVNVSEDCSVGGCPGASAAVDQQGVMWRAANWDSTTHTVQVTRHEGGVTSLSTYMEHTGLTARQPVTLVDPESGRVVVVYSTCTYVSAGSCGGRDLWYRSFADDVWSAPVLFGPTTGEQLDVSAVASGGRIHVAWLGRSQAGTGDQVYYAVVPLVG